MKRRFTFPFFLIGGFLLYAGLAFVETSQPEALPWHGPTLLLAFLTGVFVFENAQLRSSLAHTRWAGGFAVLLWFLNPWTMRPMAFQEMDSLWFALMVGLWTWLWVETGSWSTFMRGGLLTLTSFFILRLHTAGALLLLMAMLPWVIWNRRPLYWLAVAAGIAGISILLYWGVFLLQVHWTGISEPWWAAWGQARGFYSAWLDQISLWTHREFWREMAGYQIRTFFALSPFLFILGLEALVIVWRELVQSRRATAFHYGAVVATFLLIVQAGDSLVWNALWCAWIPVSLQPWLQQNQWWGTEITRREKFRTIMVGSTFLYFLAAHGWRIIR